MTMQQIIKEPVVVWQPIEGSSQAYALDSRADHTLLTGSRGGGKTEVQLMSYHKHVGVGYGPFWRGVIFDREYKHLDDLVNKSRRIFNKFNDGAKFHEGTNQYKWTWPTGEELLFRSIKKKDDYDNYHGHEYPFIGWNELTKYPTLELYQMMMSCNRSSFTPEKDSPRDKEGNILQPNKIPLKVVATTNSYGPGHNIVKKHFIDPAPYGQLIRTEYDVFNPQTQRQEIIVRTQVTLFSSWRENKYLDPIYIAGLQDNDNEAQRESWLNGSWDITAGGAFDDLWRKTVHIIPRAIIPDNWYLDRSFDWGSTRPFSVGWWAEANGEEMVLPDDSPVTFPNNSRRWAPAKGSLIRFNEWYGCPPGKIGFNRGTRLGAKAIAQGIKKLEVEMMQDGWIGNQPTKGPADNQIRDITESDNDTIEKKMNDEGISWQKCDKSKGSRRNGMELFRDMLRNALRGEGPGIYFMQNCQAAIETIPVLPRDETFEDDVDSDAEDHAYDETRYRVLKGSNRWATNLQMRMPT